MRRSTLILLCLAALASACDNGGSTAAATTAPTVTVADPTTTETFQGTLVVKGTNVHPFNVAVVPGTLNITLTQAGPPSTITVGLGVGTPDGLGGCSLASSFSGTTQAGTTPQITATVQITGSYCISIVDVGNVNADVPVTYSVTVAHT